MKYFCRGPVAAAAFLIVQGSAWAQQAPAPTAPAAPPPATSAPATPAATNAPAAATTVPVLAAPELPPSQMAAARELVIASGMSRSFSPMVPQLKEQIAPMLTRTRPDLTKDLGEVLTQLSPEFDKKTEEMIDIAAKIYARRMGEDELKQAAAFFASPVGKKYVEAQPAMLDELVVAMQTWTQQVSLFMMQRVHDEMVKRGHQF